MIAALVMGYSSALARHAFADGHVINVGVGAELRVQLVRPAFVHQLADFAIGVVQVPEHPRPMGHTSTQKGSWPTSMRSTQKVHFSTTPLGRSGSNTRWPSVL